MSVYKSLEKQIADAQKRVAVLKARRTKQENERFQLIGKSFVRAFDDIPEDAMDLDGYMARIHGVYVGKQYDENHTDVADGGEDFEIRLSDMLSK